MYYARFSKGSTVGPTVRVGVSCCAYRLAGMGKKCYVDAMMKTTHPTDT